MPTKERLEVIAAENDVDLTGARTKADVQERLDEAGVDYSDEEGGSVSEEEEETTEETEDEPTGGDVDVAEVDAGSGEGEVGPIIHAGMWVKLGTAEGIPEEHEGKIAAVLESPWISAAVGADEELHGYTFDSRRSWVLRLRDETNALITLDPDVDADEAFTNNSQMRATIHQYA